ncbi:PHB depolymerase family esterase [Streptomyces sp900129855]|uniref:PHB depolymerase family esterase n=1 Tax=Streptomyces sp. 900129855 TaxID=3155129 RepID=A0ABV2ZUY8_9ACTN
MASRNRILSFAAVAAALLLGLGAPPANASGGEGHGGCAAPAAPGLTTLSVDLNGGTYPVTVYVPKGYDGHRSVPVVLDLHGSSSNAVEQLDRSDIKQASDKHGFLVVAPNGGTAYPAGGYAWVLPGVPNTSGQYPGPQERDDIKFVSATLDAVEHGFCVDSRQVYATGYSGGARMTSLLACRLADRLAAVAPVAGLRAGNPAAADPSTVDPTTCAPSRPVPVVAFHGQADPVNPYAGGGAVYWQYSVPVALRQWATLNGCRIDRGPLERKLTEHVTRTAYAGCRAGADVQLYTISDGGHTWPGSSAVFPEGLGKVTAEVNATEVMWQFFRQHVLVG